MGPLVRAFPGVRLVLFDQAVRDADPRPVFPSLELPPAAYALPNSGRIAVFLIATTVDPRRRTVWDHPIRVKAIVYGLVLWWVLVVLTVHGATGQPH